MHRAWIIAKKEMKLLLRDLRALVILLALPLVFMTIIGFSVGEFLGARSDNAEVRVGVFNESQSELSQQIVTLLKERPGLRVSELGSLAELQRDVDAGKLDAGLVIDAEFDRRVQSLELGDVMETRTGPLSGGLAALAMRILSGDDNLGMGDLVGNLVFGEALRVIGPYVVEQNGGFPAKILESSRERHQQMELPDTTAPRIVSPRQLSYQLLVPSYTVLFVFFSVTFMARSFLNERETGTFRRLLTSPVQPMELLAGKTVPYGLLTVAQTAVLFLAGSLLFGMNWGSAPYLLVPTIVLTAAASTTLGLMIALSVRSDSQISAYVVFLLLVMGGLSGCLVPRVFLPETMQTLSLITPNAWALVAFEETLRSDLPDLARLGKCWLALSGFSAVQFVVGLLLFRQRIALPWQ